MRATLIAMLLVLVAGRRRWPPNWTARRSRQLRSTVEKVRLFPNGRWEYVDAAKAAAAQQTAAKYPENQTRPEGAQGGLFGVGRIIMPGDKDYNRGSLNPKLR